MTHEPRDPGDLNPLPLLRGLASLRRLGGMYPAGHPVIAQKLEEVYEAAQEHLRAHPSLTIDIIHGDVHVNGIASRVEGSTPAHTVRDLADLGVDSVSIRQGVEREELRRAAEFLGGIRDNPSGAPLAQRLAAHDIRHISFGGITSLDTRWQSHQWPETPPEPLDPAYAESLERTEQAFGQVASGHGLDAVTVRDLVQLLIGEVARSNAALGQILTLKEYENLTYCHSVNVAVLSLMLGRQLRLDEATIFVLVEAALLHDIGKTRVPLDIVKKPGALDRSERKLIEAHTTYGAEILLETPGLHALAPTVALEHHRGISGGGYPDLGEEAVPHVMSQIVAVADIYEAITGARSYREPLRPEQACLVLAREAGTKLNTAFVKAFVAAVTFFPVGSLVRTSRDELGIVIRTNPTDPLHPVLAVLSDDGDVLLGEVDTSTRDGGEYVRQITETLPARTHHLSVVEALASVPA